MLVTQPSASAWTLMAFAAFDMHLCCMQQASLSLHLAVAQQLCVQMVQMHCVAPLLMLYCLSCRATLPAAAPGCCHAVRAAAPKGLAVAEGWGQGHLSGRSALFMRPPNQWALFLKVALCLHAQAHRMFWWHRCAAAAEHTAWQVCTALLADCPAACAVQAQPGGPPSVLMSSPLPPSYPSNAC